MRARIPKKKTAPTLSGGEVSFPPSGPGKPAAHIATGKSGEEKALRFLLDRGFRLAARNWRPAGRARNLELDLVGNWEKCLVFVEVKTRRAPALDSEGPAGLANFTPAKQRSMVRAARTYLAENSLWDKACRFDLVCITLLPGQEPRVDHYRDVIELGQTLDSGDAAWQPW